MRVKRAPNQLESNSIESSLLDVFVIGANAHEQLDRFFKITNIVANPQDLLKLTDKMELVEFNNANQTNVTSNDTFNINQHQQIISNPQSQQSQQQQQMNINPSQLYRNHQQQQQSPQQQGLRYVNNPKVSKHRELPVDVPDSFVGVAKQSPRYPPPKPHRQVSPLPMNNSTTFNHAPSSNNPYNQTGNTNSCTQQQPVIPPTLSQNTAANIVSHNSSLRSSIKLKQLEKSRNGQHGGYPVGQMQPAINQAFELNEDDAASTNATNQVNNHHPVMMDSKQAASKPKQSIPDLCSIYGRLQRNLNGEFADVSGDAKLTKLLSIYNTIVQTHNKQFRIPTLTSRHTTTTNAQGNQELVTYKVSDLLQSVIYLLRDEEMTSVTAELYSILCKHEMDGVCSAFDRIAQSFEFAKTSRPTSPQHTVEMVPSTDNGMPQPPIHHQNNELPPYINQARQMDDYDYAPDQVQMDIENNLYQNSMHPLTDIDLSGTCTRTVCVEKTSNQALGATIKNDVDGSVIIGRIVCGGAAHGSGLLHQGDEILEVNGVQMRGKNINEVVEILEGMNGTLTFTLVARNYNKQSQRNLQEKIFVRAFFNYDGDVDNFLPCKELGLSFERGEILAIIDQSDPKWWQAHIERDKEWRLAGLIPSINFLKQREKDSNHEDIATAVYCKHEKKSFVSMVSTVFNCPKGSSPRRRKKPPHIPFGPDEIPYYEEVVTYYPIKYRKRPIILVGPKMIGQQEIVARLLQDSNRFACAVSHTSKPMQDHERNGVDFHFVSRAQFEADIKAGKFIECGQYHNHWYGTSLDAMKEVVRSKKVSCFIAHLLISSVSLNLYN